MAATVTVTLPAGTRVTCSEETAKRLGLEPNSEKQPKTAPAKKSASRKSSK